MGRLWQTLLLAKWNEVFAWTPMESLVYEKRLQYYGALQNAQKPKNREAFYESHRAEITLYEAASRYMKNHLNGRTKMPMREWRAERLKLAAENRTLSVRLHSLKGEIKKIETIRRHAEGIVRAIVPPSRQRGNSL
jgi:Fic family protein